MLTEVITGVLGVWPRDELLLVHDFGDCWLRVLWYLRYDGIGSGELQANIGFSFLEYLFVPFFLLDKIWTIFLRLLNKRSTGLEVDSLLSRCLTRLFQIIKRDPSSTINGFSVL